MSQAGRRGGKPRYKDTGTEKLKIGNQGNSLKLKENRYHEMEKPNEKQAKCE